MLDRRIIGCPPYFKSLLIHPASDSRYRFCLWISLLTCWLSFNQAGLSLYATRPLGNNNQFHRISPIPKASDLPWHDNAVVMLF